jgi:hypothetical protein
MSSPSRSRKHATTFQIREFDLDFNDDDMPMYRFLSARDVSKSFSLYIWNKNGPIFFCRFYYLNSATRKRLHTTCQYELGDVSLYPWYQGKTYRGVKYSKLCLEMVMKYIDARGITELLLWVFDDNIRAIKRYKELGFVLEENKHIMRYYKQLAKRLGYQRDIEVYKYNK